jgi:hypothetical protein
MPALLEKTMNPGLVWLGFVVLDKTKYTSIARLE